MSRTLLAALLLGLALIGLGAAVGLKLAQGQDAAQGPGDVAPIAVEVAEVRRGDIEDRRTLTGSLAALAEFTVAPKIQGRLERLFVDLGDEVTKGMLLAVLDDDELTQAVTEADAELEVAKATLQQATSAVEIAQREYDRVAELAQRNVSSAADVDVASLNLLEKQAALQVARAVVSQREAALRAEQIRLGYTEIRASWNEEDNRRVIGERLANEGDLLSPSTPVVSILDIDELKAVIYVTERDYAKLSVAQATSVVADALPGRHFEGQITRIAPVFRASSRQAQVEVSVPNPQRALKPGMFVRVGILLDRRDDVTIVPTTALVRRRGEVGVFLVASDAQTARFIPVETGIEARGEIEIAAPPLEGMVVTLGQDQLSDGSAIRVAEVSTAELSGN